MSARNLLSSISRRSALALGSASLLWTAIAHGLKSGPPNDTASSATTKEGEGDPVFSGKAWRDFCAKLADAGEAILRPDAPATSLDRAEGFRYLSRLVRIGLLQGLEAMDPDFPIFYRGSEETAKYGADNPDNVYWNTMVKGDRDYRITGTRGTIYYFSIGSKAFRMETKSTIQSTGELKGSDLKVGPDGKFEIICSSKPQPGKNWLPMTAETSGILIRQTYLDRKTEIPGTFKIERIGGPTVPAPLEPAFLEAGLQRAALFVHGNARHFGDWLQRFEAHPNQMPTLDQDFYWKAGGDPLINYRYGYYDFAPDEAWVVTMPAPDGIFWNFSLYNWWLESFDYVHRQVTVNNHTAKLNPGGTVTVIVADRDPGVGNWLDTSGHRKGVLLLRSYAAKSNPEPKCKIVKAHELKA
jgi:hypothetical protein